jgi:hypothetical protein
MSVADKGSYFSRFFVKFVEIVAAAAATAVSGYLVAHLSGYFPAQLSSFFPAQTQSPAPAAVQTAPRESSVSKAMPASSPAQPVPAISADTVEQRPAPQQDAGASSAQSAKKSAKAARKQGKGDANKADTTAATTTESKPRGGEDEESVAARVRAALANVDANRSAPAEASPRKADMPGPAATGVPPRPADVSPAAPSVAAPPRAVDVAPQPVPQAALASPPAQAAPVPPAAVQPAPLQAAPLQVAPLQAAPLQVAPVPPAPVQPDPLNAVEIKSRPVATVDTAPAPEPAPPPAEERGVLSALKHMLPDFRRPSTTGEAPRPPAPIGE